MNKDNLGLQGSPTRVVNIDRPKVTRSGKMIAATEESKQEAAVEELLEYLKGIEML